jgi:hypothetical protein
MMLNQLGASSELSFFCSMRLTSMQLFNFQWLARTFGRSLFPLFTQGSRRRLFINQLIMSLALRRREAHSFSFNFDAAALPARGSDDGILYCQALSGSALASLVCAKMSAPLLPPHRDVRSTNSSGDHFSCLDFFAGPISFD